MPLRIERKNNRMQKTFTITAPDEVMTDSEELNKSFDMSLDEIISERRRITQAWT